MSLQEKFQITTPPNPNEDDKWEETWTDFSTVRKTGEAGFAHSNNVDATADAYAKFNMMPPGMDISNQRRKRIERMPLSMAGATDVSGDVNASAFENGFTRKPMKGTDDLYTGEHVDLFYGEAEDEDGNEGFVERNNMLDRL